MSENDPYTNLDLDTAEQMLIAAGKPELAMALRHQAQGVRNLVQGEWGMSFVTALESVVAKHVGPLAEQVNGLRRDVQQSAAESVRRLGKLEADAKELRDGQLAASSRLDVHDQRLAEIEQLLRERPEQRRIEHQALLDAIRAVRGD